MSPLPGERQIQLGAIIDWTHTKSLTIITTVQYVYCCTFCNTVVPIVLNTVLRGIGGPVPTDLDVNVIENIFTLFKQINKESHS